MKLEYKVLKLDLKYPFGISREIKHFAGTVITKLTYTENGKTYVGYGEAAPSRFYGETVESVQGFYKWLQDEDILNCSPYEIAKINNQMSRIGKNYAAKAGIDIALYDLLGKIHNIPVYKYLGFENTIPKTSYTIDISDLEMILKKTGEALMQGYDILKVKLGSPKDEELIFTVRQAAPEVDIRVDANCAWSFKTALKMIGILEENKVELIEQPLAQNNITDLGILRSSTDLPIIVDESCVTCEDVIKLHGIVDGINIKLSKVGGITPALKILHTARACGMKVMVGCFLETSLGMAAAGVIASQADYVDLDGSLLLKEDPFKLVNYDASSMILSERSGIASDDII